MKSFDEPENFFLLQISYQGLRRFIEPVSKSAGCSPEESVSGAVISGHVVEAEDDVTVVLLVVLAGKLQAVDGGPHG